MNTWNGEVTYKGKTLTVEANYSLGWDNCGTCKVAYVDSLRAFDENGAEEDYDSDLIDLVEESIDEEEEGFNEKEF